MTLMKLILIIAIGSLWSAALYWMLRSSRQNNARHILRHREWDVELETEKVWVAITTTTEIQRLGQGMGITLFKADVAEILESMMLDLDLDQGINTEVIMREIKAWKAKRVG